MSARRWSCPAAPARPDGMRRHRWRRGAALAATLLVSRSALALELERVLRDRTAAPASEAQPFAPLVLRSSASLAGVPGQRRFPARTQALIVSLTVNAEAHGERVVRMTDAGEFLLRREDLAEVAGVVPETPVFTIDGDAFVPVSSIARAKASFDEKALALELTFAPESFPAKRFDLATQAAPADIGPPSSSALLNYRVGYAGTSGEGDGTLSVSAEAAIARGDWIFRNQSFHSRSPTETRSSRLETQAIRDDRENLRRLIVGDSATPGLALGSSVQFAGLTLAKAYALSPYLSRQPSVGYRGIAEFPSQVDFYVGNTLVLRQQVGPGPFDIRNFSYYGGQRDVRVVIRDVLGREQSIAYPFYFATQGLAAGLHDYSYQAGWLRSNAGAPGDSYGRFAFAAFHQYGFTDRWTLGLRTEGTARKANGGVDAFYRDETLGAFAVHAAASADSDTHANGHALSATHSFQRGEVSTQLTWQGYSKNYAVLAEIAPRLPRSDLSMNVAYAAPWLGSLGVGLTRLALHAEAAARSWNATYSRPLFGRLNLIATFRRQLTEPRGNDFYFGLQYVPGSNQVAQASVARDVRGVRTTSAQWGSQVPQGEGLAYSLGVQRQEAAGDATHVITPRLEWHTRVGTLGAEVTQVRGSTDTTAYSLSFSGALVSAEGRFALSRAVADSFAIVEITPPLEGVLVYENSQEVGRTDARGRVLLPNIASYASNYASVKDKDVPIDYSIDRVGRSFSPPYRSGTLVPFRFERMRAFTGRLRYRLGVETLPLENHLVEIEAGGRKFEVPTGKGGMFYVENLPAGRAAATVRIRSTRCDFALEIPATGEAHTALGDIMTCNVAR